MGSNNHEDSNTRVTFNFNLSTSFRVKHRHRRSFIALSAPRTDPMPRFREEPLNHPYSHFSLRKTPPAPVAGLASAITMNCKPKPTLRRGKAMNLPVMSC
ncbi:Hypothetical predicted protein [Prunus dulcis]|uniref:Uncharacterized protein n=1 Tax=Prunus dulcis TaxID=3755 RepID=A0A5E4F340_PRUDU|nr:hypothetical protein L3X38_006692 [Prunus dulcis]VVA22515.1 Hypothetical predicted protein [Prunus dulcis]